ncbi:hypothetical protein GE09DRAFT_312362 [Coniochaeta sp. 2T2.1]|nr:hypothetical protein GE09DRAFT_312362 [Coniochaeta sp. 2T2.1]
MMERTGSRHAMVGIVPVGLLGSFPSQFGRISRQLGKHRVGLQSSSRFEQVCCAMVSRGKERRDVTLTPRSCLPVTFYDCPTAQWWVQGFGRHSPRESPITASGRHFPLLNSLLLSPFRRFTGAVIIPATLLEAGTTAAKTRTPSLPRRSGILSTVPLNTSPLLQFLSFAPIVYSSSVTSRPLPPSLPSPFLSFLFLTLSLI